MFEISLFVLGKGHNLFIIVIMRLCTKYNYVQLILPSFNKYLIELLFFFLLFIIIISILIIYTYKWQRPCVDRITARGRYLIDPISTRTVEEGPRVWELNQIIILFCSVVFHTKQ